MSAAVIMENWKPETTKSDDWKDESAISGE